MTNIIDFIKSRRSARMFTDQTIKKEDIQEILEAGMSSPSLHNQQPREFVVITDKEQLSRIGASFPHAKMVPNSQATIALCFDENKVKNLSYIQQEMAICGHNIVLSAFSKGIGTCRVGIYPDPERSKLAEEYFQFPDGIKVLTFLPLGYPADVPYTKDFIKPEKIHWKKR